MSGRLVILPKKSYCPWNPSNVERVLRDERLEKERLERQAKEKVETESRLRLEQLKQNAGTTTQPETTTTANQEHVDLFQAEERAMIQKTLVGNVNKQTQRRNKGVMPVVLGGTQLQNRGENAPFYLKPNTLSQDSPLEQHISQREERRKARMDPMHQFVSQTSSQQHPSHKERIGNDDHVSREEPKREKKKKRRKKTSRRDKKRPRKETSSSACSMEELRRRRVEREQDESRRQAALAHKQHGTRHDGHYQDQYHPGLSRN